MFILLATTVCTLRKCLHVADTFFVVLVLVLQHELFSLFWLLLGVLQGTQKYPNPRLFPFSYPLAVCFGFVYFFFLLQPACLGAQNWFWTRLCCSCGPSFVVVAILCIVVVRASCRKWKLIRSPQISAQGYRIRIRTQIRATCVTDLIIIIYVHMYVLIYIHILVCMRAYMCAKEL